jgi:hypothetical protein
MEYTITSCLQLLLWHLKASNRAFDESNTSMSLFPLPLFFLFRSFSLLLRAEVTKQDDLQSILWTLIVDTPSYLTATQKRLVSNYFRSCFVATTD